MKRIILAAIFLSIFHLPSCTLHGQNVGISTTGVAPNGSSLLDIDASPANNKGLLIPRVSFAQRTGTNFNPLPAAAQGLFIYQTDAGGFGEGFYYNTSATTTPAWVKLFTNTTGWSLTGNAGTSGGPNFLGTTDNISLRFRTNNTQKMIIDSMGNVGIGTANPLRLLHISQSVTSASTLLAIDNPDLTNTNGSVISFRGNTTGTGASSFVEFSAIQHTILLHDHPTRTSDMGFFTSNSGTLQEAVRIKGSGNVGIGTITPSRKLHVNGNIQVDGDIYGGLYGGSRGIWRFSTADPNFGIFYSEASPDVISFSPNGGGTTSPSMVIAGGNVGIGTITPGATLEVAGQVKITGGLPAAGKVLTSDATGLATWAYTSNPWENMGTNVQQICAGGTAGTDYEWGVTYNNASPILRVTCTGWNTGNRVCTYPPYPTGDSEPFNWGGACWIWGTNSAWDDACSGAGQAYHSYYYQDANGKYFMAGGNGCGSLPTVYRRKL